LRNGRELPKPTNANAKIDDNAKTYLAHLPTLGCPLAYTTLLAPFKGAW